MLRWSCVGLQYVLEPRTGCDPRLSRPYVPRSTDRDGATDDAGIEQVGDKVTLRERSPDDELVGSLGPAGDLKIVSELVGPAPRHLDERHIAAGHDLPPRAAVVR